MKKDNDSISSSLELPSSTLDLTGTLGLYVNNRRSDVASRLFSMSVDLQAVLEKKRDLIHAEIRKFIAEIQSKRTELVFEGRSVSIPIEEDKKVGGFSSAVWGVFGYERRVRQTRYATSKQLNTTRDIKEKVAKFITEVQAEFNKKVLPIVDVDSTVAEFTKLAAQELQDDEFAILRVAIRRSFSKISLKPMIIKFELNLPHAILMDADEIVSATQKANQAVDRLCYAIVSKANGVRRKFDRDLETIFEGMNEELVAACLARKKMEQMLQMALVQQNGWISDPLLARPLTDSSLRVVSPLGSDFARRLLNKP